MAVAKGKTVQITVVLPEKTCDSLKALAAAKHLNMSDIVRGFIAKGLSVESYQENIDFISGIVRQEVKAEVGTQVERLVKILMKVGIISSSNYFLAVRMLSDVISPSMQADFKDIHTNARRQGVDYMKLKDYDVTAFMEDEDRISAAVAKIKTDVMEEY